MLLKNKTNVGLRRLEIFLMYATESGIFKIRSKIIILIKLLTTFKRQELQDCPVTYKLSKLVELN